jgi:hypothetical protein
MMEPQPVTRTEDDDYPAAASSESPPSPWRVSRVLEFVDVYSV